MGTGKDAYENRQARVQAEHERWERDNARKVEADLASHEILLAFADLLTGRRFIATEQRGPLLKIEISPRTA